MIVTIQGQRHEVEKFEIELGNRTELTVEDGGPGLVLIEGQRAMEVHQLRESILVIRPAYPMGGIAPNEHHQPE